jgi:hypothetical protein
MSTSDWRASLAELRPELGELLRGWIPQLIGLVGPCDARPRQDAEGELDGFRGLTRRGRWDHLVHSQWALARSVPIEFLRRATEGELLFADPARVRPAEAPHTTVFFDDGPSQLGVPRLVHLALWVVFAERAREGSGTLTAFARSAPHRPLEHPTDLLRMRSTSLPDLPDGPREERFVVGRPVEGEEVVEVVDSDDGASVTVRFRGRELVLHPPGLVTAARLLRRPTPPDHTPRIDQGERAVTAMALWSGKLYVRFGPVLTVWPLPRGRRERTRPNHQSGRWRREQRTLVAVGRFARQLLLVETDGDDLVLAGSFGTHRVPLPHGLVVPGEDQLCPAVGMPRVYVRASGTTRAGAVFRDGAGGVWLATAHPPTTRRLGQAVVGPVGQEGLLLWVEPTGERVGSSLSGEEDLVFAPGDHLQTRRLVEGPVTRGLRAGARGVALQRDGRIWVGPCFGWGRLGEGHGQWFDPMDPAAWRTAVWLPRPSVFHLDDDGQVYRQSADGQEVVVLEEVEVVRRLAVDEERIVTVDAADRLHVHDHDGHRLVSFGWDAIR